MGFISRLLPVSAGISTMNTTSLFQNLESKFAITIGLQMEYLKNGMMEF